MKSVLSYAETQRSSALLVQQRGEPVVERYWSPDGTPFYRRLVAEPTAAGEPVEDVASLQKSVVSILVGVAADRGLLELDDPVSAYLKPGWSRATRERESAIRLRHLLTMTSGLTASHEYRAPPGTRWQYNTRVYSNLVDVLEAVAGNGIAALTHSWLAEPLGLAHTAWRPRRWVTPEMDANGLGLYSTARDLARVGELMLSGGTLDGRRVVSAGYLRAATTPSQQLNRAYGYLWWVNGRPPEGATEAASPTLWAPAAPPDMFAAQGALGRKLYVAASLDLVVVRLGDAPDPDFNAELWARLMASLAPASVPP